MNRRLLPRPARLLAGITVVALVATLQPSHAALCPKPEAFPAGDSIPSADGTTWFSPGTTATVGWDAGESGGFRIEWSTSPSTNTDGSFASPLGTTATTASKREITIGSDPPLAELTHYFHVRAKKKDGVCDASRWSNTVAITQDATAPSVSIDTPVTTVPVAGEIPAPIPVFINQATIRITGSAIDAPGPAVDASSGALLVVLTAQNTTPAIGASSEPVDKVAFVDTDGTWLADFTGLGLGTWTIAATGIDRAGNEAATPETLDILVVAAP